MDELLSIAATLLRAVIRLPVGLTSTHVNDILLAIAAGLDRGADALPQLRALHDTVAAMVSAHQDPTLEQLTELKTRSDAAFATLQTKDA